MNKFNRVLQHATSLTLALLCTLAILAGIDGLAQPDAGAALWAQPAQSMQTASTPLV